MGQIIIVTGFLGKDPEVRHLDNGMAVANFSIATDESYKNKAGEKISETEWHDVVIWGKLAEIVEKYVKKGSLIQVTGKIKTRSWEKDGQKFYKKEIISNQMEMLGGKPKEGISNQSNNASDDIDDLPFD